MSPPAPARGTSTRAGQASRAAPPADARLVPAALGAWAAALAAIVLGWGVGVLVVVVGGCAVLARRPTVASGSDPR